MARMVDDTFLPYDVSFAPNLRIGWQGWFMTVAMTNPILKGLPGWNLYVPRGHFEPSTDKPRYLEIFRHL
jgi:hypothetical protein